MKIFTTDDIRAWAPCYDPSKVVPPDWSGTVLDMLAIEHMSLHDRLWAVLRPECVSDASMRAFVVRFGNGINPDKVVDLRNAARHAASWHRTRASQTGLNARTLWERIAFKKPNTAVRLGRGILAVAAADREQIEFLTSTIVEEFNAEA